jgi:hypothetical protein
MKMLLRLPQLNAIVGAPGDKIGLLHLIFISISHYSFMPGSSTMLLHETSLQEVKNELSFITARILGIDH